MVTICMLTSKLAAASILILSTSLAQADDWGCEVLLCMANPAGPTALVQCVPAITKLWKHLAKGHGFPTCFQASGQRSSARHTTFSPEYCPDGYLRQSTEGKDVRCALTGVTTVITDGAETQRVWWSEDGTGIPEPLAPTVDRVGARDD